MTHNHALSRAATAARTTTSNRPLFFALAAGLTIATVGFGLALVGGARADDVALIDVAPDNFVRAERDRYFVTSIKQGAPASRVARSSMAAGNSPRHRR